MHVFDRQSPLLLHDLPLSQTDAQVGGWQRLFAQRPDPQSLFAPQLLPALHLPGAAAHGGGAQVPAVQTFDEQSLVCPQVVPFEHEGEHVGAEHLPPMHCPEAQSAFDPQTWPPPQVGAHNGGWQTPLVQTPDWQSPFPAQGLLSVQLGEQADHWTQVPSYRRVPSFWTCDCNEATVYPAAFSRASVCWYVRQSRLWWLSNEAPWNGASTARNCAIPVWLIASTRDG